MENKTFMEKIVEKARGFGGAFYKITVIQDGVSETSVITPANGAQNSYSIAKAYTVTAIGMLHDKGLISMDEKICDIFADEIPEGIDEKWKEMTVHHVMKHRCGFCDGYLDIDAVDHSFISDGDYLKYLFNTKLMFTPGTEFHYSDAAFYLLSRVFTKKSGVKMDDYLLEHLFSPLKFREMAWSKCPKGYPMGATGLYVYTEDVAKLGQLYLNKGVYNGKRIISEEWIDIVERYEYEFGKTAGGGYAKGGAFGQMLAYYPKKNMVLAYHSYGGDIFGFADTLE